MYDKREDFNFKIINFPNMWSNIPGSPAYGVYILQLIRYARANSNYSDFLKRHLPSHIDNKICLTFLLTFLSLYIFTVWKCNVYYRLCSDRIYFDKILVSEYKLFKRSNKANLLIALLHRIWYCFDIYFTYFVPVLL
jgi:hypothetical protein